MKRYKLLNFIFLIVALFSFAFLIYVNIKVYYSDFKEENSVLIAALKGPTGLGMLKLVDDETDKNNLSKYDISLYSEPSQIIALLYNNETDIATLPVNVASMLYNKMDGLHIQMLAINSLSNLYVISDEYIEEVADLKSKDIYISGKGATPEFMLNYLLMFNNIVSKKDINVFYKPSNVELSTELSIGSVHTGILPEPFATKVLSKNSRMKIVLNVADEWKKTFGDKSVIPMGCIVSRKEFIDGNGKIIKEFLSKYCESINYVINNVNESAYLAEKYNIIDEKTAIKAIPKCDIVYIDGDEMINITSNFLKILLKQDPKIIGGYLPNENFYYKP